MIGRYFSNPYEGGFFSVAQRFSREYFSDTLARCRNAGYSLPIAADNLAGKEVKDVDRLACFGAEAAVLRLALASSPDDAPCSGWFRLQATLAGLAAGEVTHVSDEAFATRPLIFAGEVVPRGRISVECHGNTLSVCSEGRRFDFSRRHAGETNPIWTRHDASEPIRFGTAHQLRIADTSWFEVWNIDAPAARTSTDIDKFKARLMEVGEALEEHSPAYYLWICTVLKEVALLGRDANSPEMLSQSFACLPGQVHISLAPKFETVNMLVHECSHQFYYLIAWCQAIVATDAPAAYSMLKLCERPADKVLLGFHAMGNILLAMNDLGLNSARVEKTQIDRQINFVAKYAESLRDSILPIEEDGYTEIGLELFRPLHGRLLDADLISAMAATYQ